jgi:hypothetical protein
MLACDYRQELMHEIHVNELMKYVARKIKTVTGEVNKIK